MVEQRKVTARSANIRSIAAAPQITAVKASPNDVKEIDLAMNTIDSAAGLEIFQALENLNIDHNRFNNLVSFPRIDSLKNLSISYNNLTDFDMTMAALF